MDNLTSEAEYVLLKLYKKYKKQLKETDNRQLARNVGSGETVAKDIFENKYSFESVVDILGELSPEVFSPGYTTGLLDIGWGNNQPVRIFITPKAISLMQDRFKNKTSALIDAIAKLKNIIM